MSKLNCTGCCGSPAMCAVCAGKRVRKMSYPKYSWVGNRIPDEDMASLYRLKEETRVPISERRQGDFIYCETCQMFVDFWKYDYNIEWAGHEDCKWRYVTEPELKECEKECLENGCLKNDK